MIKHIWSLLCRNSVIDSDTNNLSIHDILEQLNIDAVLKEGQSDTAQQSVNIPLEFEVVSFWLKTNGEEKPRGELNIEAISPEGKVLTHFLRDIEIPKEVQRLRTRLKITGLVVEGSGTYIFRISLREKSEDAFANVAEIPLQVNINRKVKSSA